MKERTRRCRRRRHRMGDLHILLSPSAILYVVDGPTVRASRACKIVKTVPTESPPVGRPGRAGSAADACKKEGSLYVDCVRGKEIRRVRFLLCLVLLCA